MNIEPDSVETMLVTIAKHRAEAYVQGYEDGSRDADPLISQAYNDGHHDGAKIGSLVATGTAALYCGALIFIILVLLGIIAYPHLSGSRISLGLPLIRM